MITVKNLKDLLTAIGYSESSSGLFSRRFNEFDCEISVDFNNGCIKYPEDKGFKVNDRTTSNFDHPENFVVLECVSRLLLKGYRPEHLELEKKWSLGHDASSGKADICVYDADGEKMLLIIECKTAGNEYRKEHKNILNDGGQLFSYWQQERSSKWLCLYSSDITSEGVTCEYESINCSDDENLIKLNKKDSDVLLYKDAHTVPELFKTWEETYFKKLWKGLIFDDDTVAYKIGVKPIKKKDLRDFSAEDRIPEHFAEILRHNNVSDKENAFNRLLALFICKLVDEIRKGDDDVVEFQYKQGTDTYESLQDRLQRLHHEGMKDFMGEDIFYVSADYPDKLFSNYTGHRRAAAIEDLKNTIRILKFYSNNDFAFKDVHNEELFFQNGKILVEVVQLFEHAKIIEPNDPQFLGNLFETLLSDGFRQDEGQYFTPKPITRFIWDSLPVKQSIEAIEGGKFPKVIDYACGAGHFLTEAVDALLAEKPLPDKSWIADSIFGIEKDYRLARVAKVALFMNGAGNGNIIFGDGLDQYKDKKITNGTFDIIVANPPKSFIPCMSS